MTNIKKSGFYVVVLVGGKGRRLRPLSTVDRPKAFLSFTRDRKTIFRRTLDRVRSLVPRKNIIVVANHAHSKLVLKDFPDIRSENLILEPVSRNTAPAIALAASILAKRDPSAVMIVLPTDQYITEEEKFLSPVRRGFDFVRKNRDAIVVLGVTPRYPSAHFGYIKAGKGSITKVQKFVEKPDRKTAETYLKNGSYLWNTGAFIFRADFILKLFNRLAPGIYDTIICAGAKPSAYKKAPDISMDYAIIERYRNIYCVKAEYEWHDVGGFESLIKILTREGRKFELKGGKVVKIK